MWWKILLSIILLLLVICLVRAALSGHKAKPASAFECSKEQMDEYGKQFGDLIRIPTLSKPDDPSSDLSAFDAYHAKVDELFPLVHETMEKTELNGVLLYRWKGKNPELKPILFMGHQDVVPADDEGWSHKPFSGDYEDGILWGRGTVDDKCNLFTQLSAVEQLLKEGYQPEEDIWFEYSIDEETSGPGAAHAVRYLKEKGLEFALVMDEGGAVLESPMKGIQSLAAVGVTEKGYLNIKFTSRSHGGHAATPGPVTNVTNLCAFVNEVNKKKPFKRKMTPEARAMIASLTPALPFYLRFFTANLWLFSGILVAVMSRIGGQVGAIFGTTCAFTMMHGSEAENVMPSAPYVIANIRTGYCQNIDESIAVLKKIADKYHLDMETYDAREASPVTRTDTTEFAYLTSVIHKVYPEAVVVPYVMTGGTDCRHFTVISKNCLRFFPGRLTVQQMSSCHGIDENISINAIAQTIVFYKEFIKGYQAASQ